MLGLVRRRRRRGVQRLPAASRRARRSGSTAATARSATCRSTSAVEDLTAVVLTHGHPDHCVDIYGLHVLLRYGLGREDLPVFAPEGLEKFLLSLVVRLGQHVRLARGRRRRHARRSATSTLRFSRTDHPPPTYAVEAHRRRPAADLHRRHRARAGRSARSRPGADLVLSEATYLARQQPRADPPVGASRPASAAREAGAQRLILTHLWPHARPPRPSRRAAEAFGGARHPGAAGPRHYRSDAADPIASGRL